MRNSGPPFSGPLGRLSGVSLKSTASANGASSASLATSGSPVANSLLRFSVEALTGNGSAENNSIGQLNGSEESKLDLSNLSLMNMAARLGYSGYFGGLGGFTQLNQLNQAFNGLGVLEPSNVTGSNLTGQSNGPLGAHSASSGRAMSDEDDDDDDLLDDNLSINSWDDDEPPLESEDEDFKSAVINKKLPKRTKRRSAPKMKLDRMDSGLDEFKMKAESNVTNRIEENSEAMDDDEDEDMEDEHNIEIMEDNEATHKFNTQSKQTAPLAS